MSAPSRLRRLAVLPGICAVMLLTACNNQYGPPVEGQPLTYGQQRYLDNQAYQELNENRRTE